MVLNGHLPTWDKAHRLLADTKQRRQPKEDPSGCSSGTGTGAAGGQRWKPPPVPGAAEGPLLSDGQAAARAQNSPATTHLTG